MLFTSRSAAAFSTVLLSVLMGVLANSAPATAAPYDKLEQSCKPKLEGTHACLEPVPNYSYHLGLTSDYSGELCVSLGDWDGDNDVVVEWDGLQTQLQLSGKAGVQQLLQPEQREGRSSAVVVYSDQPILPHIVERGCGSGRELHKVTAVSWPGEAAENRNVAQLPSAGPGPDAQQL